MTTTSRLWVTLSALALLAADAQAQPRPMILGPGSAGEVVSESALSGAPPFVHWDLRELSCAIPWDVGSEVPDLNRDGRTDAADRAAAISTIARAFDAWRDVAPAVIGFVRGNPPPAGTNPKGLALDGYNIVGFEELRGDDVYASTGAPPTRHPAADDVVIDLVGGPPPPRAICPGNDREWATPLNAADVIAPVHFQDGVIIDCILAGANGTLDSLPDLNQRARVDARSVVVEPGANGVLETQPGGDDQVSRRAVGGVYRDLIVDGGNGINESSRNNEGSLGGDSIGLTGLFFDNATGAIREADIVLTQRVTWVLGDANNDRALNQISLQGTTTHEIGHFLGIAHPRNVAVGMPHPAPTMIQGLFTYFNGTHDNLTLEAADRDSLNFLYSHDLGDAPDPLAGTGSRYPTHVTGTLASGVAGELNGLRRFRPRPGPSHLFHAVDRYQYEWLGPRIETADSARECGAHVLDGDGSDDGVFHAGAAGLVPGLPELVPGGPAVDVTMEVRTGIDADGNRHDYATTPIQLDAWFDWNADGSFDGPGEHVLQGRAVSPATPITPEVVAVTAPADARPGGWARFRLRHRELAGVPANLPTGVSQFGEVEDYPIRYARAGEPGAFIGFPDEPVTPVLVPPAPSEFDVDIRPDPVGAGEESVVLVRAPSPPSLLALLRSFPSLLSPREVVAREPRGRPSLLTVSVAEGQQLFDSLTIRFGTLRDTGALGAVFPPPTEPDAVTVPAGTPVVLEVFPERLLDGRPRATSLLDARGFAGIRPDFDRIVLHETIENPEVAPVVVQDFGFLLDQRIEILPTSLDVCPLPLGKRRIHGDLVVPPGSGLCMPADRAKHLLEPDAFYLGRTAAMTASAAYDIELRTFEGDLTMDGRVDLAVSDDLTLMARKRAIDVRGPIRTVVGDTLTVMSRHRGIALTPAGDSGAALPGEVVAGRIRLSAPGEDGTITVENTRLAARQILLDTRSSVSQLGDKGVSIGFRSVLTTDPVETGRTGSAGDVRIESTGDVRIGEGARIASGRNVVIATRGAGDRLCLSGGVVIAAAGGAGRIDLSRVRGGVYDDGTTVLNGVVVGELRSGDCPGPLAGDSVPTTTSTSPTLPPSTSSTSTTLASQDARWRFYVRIMVAGGGTRSVNVPKSSGSAPVTAEIRTEDLAAFPLGRRVTGAEIAALGGDTLTRLTTAADAYLASHPDEVPDFVGVEELRWAQREAP